MTDKKLDYYVDLLGRHAAKSGEKVYRHLFDLVKAIFLQNGGYVTQTRIKKDDR